MANLSVITRILVKQWKNLRPVHIYQGNYFAGLSLQAMSGVLTLSQNIKNTPSTGTVCLHLILIFFSKVNMVYDIVIMQADRFLAVRKPLYHRTEVTAGLSWKVVGGSKVFVSLIVVGGILVDPELILCADCHRNYAAV